MHWRLFLKSDTGLKAERYALRYLKRQGLKLQEKNYACMFGEIDLVMREGNRFVFVEVRFRSSNRYGHAEETVSFSKQKKIITVARHYLQRCSGNIGIECRFDILAISSDNSSGKWKVDWIKNAFMCFPAFL